jgi:hypothetical protein
MSSESMRRVLRTVRSIGDPWRLDFREAHGKAGAAVLAGTVGDDRSALEFDQAAHERQPDAEATLRAIRRTLGLGEEPEDMRQQRRVDACAVVANVQDHLAIGDFRAQVELAAGGGEFRRVVEQVGDDLREPGAIAPDPERGPRAGACEAHAGAHRSADAPVRSRWQRRS